MIDAVVTGGSVCVMTDDGPDLCLSPTQVATLFGVPPSSVARWADRYGPLGDLPPAQVYPIHVPDGHVVLHGRRLVRESAVRAWHLATFGAVRRPGGRRIRADS